MICLYINTAFLYVAEFSEKGAQKSDLADKT